MAETEKQNILLVDDRSENLLALETLLEGSNLNMVKAASGKEALWLLLEYDFALILLDVQMPDMDGFEAAELIRGREKTKYIPIIFVTGISKEQKHVFKGYEAGAVDYLLKPIEPTILKSKVKVFLELHKQKKLIERQSDVLRENKLALQESYAGLEAKVKERTVELLAANKILQEEIIKRKQAEGEMKDLTVQLKISNDSLEKLTLTDPLTELLNRRGLQQVLSKELQKLARQDKRGLLAVLADLDNFKRVNDTLGHAVGDIVLKERAAKLEASLRSKDHVSRIGGDEFLILLPQTLLAEGLQVAERMRLAISDTTISSPSGTAKTTASVGIVKVSQGTPSVDELLSQMHCVLHRSKQQGKNRVSTDWGCKQCKDGKCLSQSNILEALQSKKQFHTVTLPIFRLADGRKVGYELLSRLSVPGFELPGDFFRFCMEANILPLVDHHCFKNCIAATLSLPRKSRYHVNLFPSTLIDIPVRHLLEDFPADIPKGTYCIEISEQQIIGNPSHLLKPVNALKEAGILIALDDVGFGHSSLESLVLLQPDIIKIDEKCVVGITRNALKVQSFERILKVAGALKTQVVVEGIESQESLDLLKRLGVKYGQGYFWGKPT